MRPTKACTDRDEMVQQHFGLVHHVARRLRARMGEALALDDMISAGAAGLVRAVDGFSPARAVAFSTYAAPVIRGAILDEARRLDPASRLVRLRQRAVKQAEAELTGELVRRPTDGEVATRLAITTAELWSWRSAVQECNSIPLDSACPHATRDVPADEALEREEQVIGLQNAMAGLPDRERIVLTLYYYEDMKLREIGELLGLTESRVSQIRTSALAKLRVSMN